MASLLIFNSYPRSLPIPTRPPRASFRPPQQHVPFYQRLHLARKRTLVVTRAGGPNITTTVLAFALPLSLLLLTVFASIRVADKLDEKFLEELILQQAMKEADEDEEEEDDDDDDDDDDEDDVETFLEKKAKEAVLPRTRNRPKREA